MNIYFEPRLFTSNRFRIIPILAAAFLGIPNFPLNNLSITLFHFKRVFISYFTLCFNEDKLNTSRKSVFHFLLATGFTSKRKHNLAFFFVSKRVSDFEF
jgi:hypothetical protein